MSGDVIKSFLVGLGFGVDDSSLSKFNKAIKDATLKVTALYGSINVTTAAIVKGISSISEGFEDLGYELRLIAPSINKAIVLRRELLRAYSAAGINLKEVVQNSVRLNMSLTKTKFALEAIYKSVGSRFFTLLTKQSDIFRNNIYKNMPKITAALEKFVKFVFKAFEAVTILGTRMWSILTRVYDFFISLDKATDGWSTVILGVIAAWRWLNLEFLASPLGLILALGVALLALWDDFKTFQEGGESLINWGGETARTVVGLVTIIGGLAAAFAAVELAIAGATAAIALWNSGLTIAAVLEAAVAAPIWLIVAAVGALIGALTLADSKWKWFGGGLSDFFGGVGGKVMGLVGGANGAANLQNNPATQSVANPVSNSTQNSLVNQNVNQQTAINVMSSADAQSVGKAVGNEQYKVNFDLTRNLKGAAR